MYPLNIYWGVFTFYVVNIFGFFDHSLSVDSLFTKAYLSTCVDIWETLPPYPYSQSSTRKLRDFGVFDIEAQLRNFDMSENPTNSWHENEKELQCEMKHEF